MYLLCCMCYIILCEFYLSCRLKINHVPEYKHVFILGPVRMAAKSFYQLKLFKYVLLRYDIINVKNLEKMLKCMLL
jgi:hypothetical protein